MKNLTICFLLSFFLWGCTQMESEDLSRSGEVKFKSISISSFSGNMQQAGTEAVSAWKHVFKDRARLEVTDSNTGKTYGLDYNPNALGEGLSLSLPYGSYTYFSEVEGGKFERYLPFRIEGDFILNGERLDLTLNATTDFGLVTVKNEHLSSLAISHGPDSYEMARLEDGSNFYLYVRNGLDPVLEINETVENQQINKKIPVQEYNHYHFFLRLVLANGSANLIELALGKFEAVEEGIEIGELETGTFVDPRDGQTYRTVRIGAQIWMAENLNYETADSWCYDNDPSNCDKYGRLYKRGAALTVCPEGWYLPDDNEWEILRDFLGGGTVAGGKMKSTTGWEAPNTGATNQSGFSGLPGGRFVSDYFDFLGKEGYWWSTDEEVGAIILWERSESFGKGFWEWLSGFAFSCRCLKGIEEGDVETGTFVDPRDGQVYQTVSIREQTWMAENLNYASEGSWCYDNDPANCEKYGRLYEREAALAACPDGWHLSRRKDWQALVGFAGGLSVAGTKLKATTGWDPTGTGNPPGGSNETGFSALPGGQARAPTTDQERFEFSGAGSYGTWWLFDQVWYEFRDVGYFTNNTVKLYNSQYVDLAPHSRPSRVAYSCRCLKD